ncbi:MAG TPA: iduronate-2-sulfatase [Phycisphaerales bacterium]|nr:iduronate-2-sulfatase [Phycisphaerales bacterium]
MKPNRRDFVKYSLGGILAASTAGEMAAKGSAKKITSGKKKNVLFIIVEDFKNIMGCYGNPLVQTPNIDRLAQMGLKFDRAYCQYPVCNPSRSSFMTGLRVDTVGIYENVTPWTRNIGHVVTMPRLFKDNGYHTIRMNKVFHGTGLHDDPGAWSEMYDMGTNKLGHTGQTRNLTNGVVPWCSWLAANGTDEDQQDGVITSKAIELLKQKREKTFFMALGLAKPHDPFNAPKKYFDMYNLDELMPPVMPDNRYPEQKYTIQSGWKASFDKFTLQDKREYLRAYYACTSFVDAQIGKVLKAMDDENLWKDTIVLFIGDHGYNLGEHEWWNKNVLFEDSCRVPMIAVIDGQTKAGTTCGQLVELIDIFQTFADLCGLNTPKGLEGLSFRPLLSNPYQKWKKGAYTQVRRGRELDGKSVRTKRFRYIEWRQKGKVIARELYDHASDAGEYRNLAKKKEFAGTCKELNKLLKSGQNELEK